MTQSFDVFLSHNSRDKPAVRKLAQELRARGLKVWLDEWELVPGRPWQKALEEVIETCRSAIVLVGKDGLGPWHEAEMWGCLEEFVRRGLPVIPVLLPGVPAKPKLPLFLKRLTWVDLRGGLTKEGIDRLQWGVTGKRPGTPEVNTTHTPARAASTRLSFLTWRIIFSITVLVVLVVITVGFARLQRPQEVRDARQDEQQRQIIVLVREGRQYLRAGDPISAENKFRQAETIAPEAQKASLARLRMEAERQAQATRQLDERQRQIERHLITARQAILDQRFDVALAAVESVLLLDPNNRVANELRAEITNLERPSECPSAEERACLGVVSADVTPNGRPECRGKVTVSSKPIDVQKGQVAWLSIQAFGKRNRCDRRSTDEFIEYGDQCSVVVDGKKWTATLGRLAPEAPYSAEIEISLDCNPGPN